MSKVKTKLSSPTFTVSNKVERITWQLVYICLFRFSPTPFFKYRVLILKLFGAKLGMSARVYPSVKIWLPRNLRLEPNVTIGPFVNVYNQGVVSISAGAIISQGAYLCASTHDYNIPIHPLILAPISIGMNAWVCADAFVGPNVFIAEGGVIGARAVVSKNTAPWVVYAGNPAKKVGERNRFN